MTPERALVCVGDCGWPVLRPSRGQRILVRHGVGTRSATGRPRRSVVERCLSRGGLRERALECVVSNSGKPLLSASASRYNRRASWEPKHVRPRPEQDPRCSGQACAPTASGQQPGHLSGHAHAPQSDHRLRPGEQGQAGQTGRSRLPVGAQTVSTNPPRRTRETADARKLGLEPCMTERVSSSVSGSVLTTVTLTSTTG